MGRFALINFQITYNVDANFLIHLVITITVKLHKCLIETRNKNL